MADYSTTGYDIQGQVISTDTGETKNPLPTGFNTVDKFFSQWTKHEDESLIKEDSAADAAGTGPNLIPSTSPSLQKPVIPGELLTSEHKKDLEAQAEITNGPFQIAIDANAQAMKNMGVLEVTKADVDETHQGLGVLNKTLS